MLTQTEASDDSYSFTVLFDLDGTLVDSVHDLAWTANELRRRRGLRPVPTSEIRSVITDGTSAMVAAALGRSSVNDRTREEFLTIYEQGCRRDVRFFTGMDVVLDHLDSCNISWGIVTNKFERFAAPMLETLGLASRARCIVCGDSTPHIKPNPASLMLAAELCKTAPKQCIYIGDAETDVQAARAAGMESIIATFGYIPPGRNPALWGANYQVNNARELIALLTID